MDRDSKINKRKKTWERRLLETKKKHRPKLQNWSRDRFARDVTDSRYDDFVRITRMPSQITEIDHARDEPLSVESLTKIDRISCAKLSVRRFLRLYERPSIPLVIKDIPKLEGWLAHNRWHLSNKSFFKRQLGMRYFKIGEDDDGYKVKVRMKYFLKYLRYNQDDSPMYVFDGSFDDDEVSKCLLQQYRVPSYFPDDIFSLVGEKRRPPYRWFLIGPERSGSCVHIDPLGTSAWNTLLQGRKRWVLFPPGTSKTIVKGLDVIKKGEDDEAVNYFVDILPRILKTYKVQSIEFTQEAGETVFVPGGWWHAVLNIEDTIAVTQNFCSRNNFPQVWRKTRVGRKKMAIKWLSLLDEQYPDLAAEARKINDEDNFTMSTKEKKGSDKKSSRKRRSSSTDGETESSIEEAEPKRKKMK